MTLNERAAEAERTSIGWRRFGYILGIFFNLVGIAIVLNVLSWGVVGWLTPAFHNVEPVLVLSMTIAIVVNAVYLVYDPGWVKDAGEIVNLLFVLVSVLFLFRVFPFDFSAFVLPLDIMVRVGLAFVAVGLIIGIIGHFASLIRWMAEEGQEDA